MDDKLIEKVMQEVMKRVGADAPGKSEPAPKQAETRIADIGRSCSGHRVRRRQFGRQMASLLPTSIRQCTKLWDSIRNTGPSA